MNGPVREDPGLAPAMRVSAQHRHLPVQTLTCGQLDLVHKLVHDAEARARDRTPTEVSGQTRKPGSHKWSHPGS